MLFFDQVRQQRGRLGIESGLPFDRALQPAPGMIPVAYTVSIGVAMLEEEESITGLMARADKALYAAKAAGRNRVVSAPLALLDRHDKRSEGR